MNLIYCFKKVGQQIQIARNRPHFKERYKILKLLGEGAEGFVYTVLDTKADENESKM